MSLLTMLEWCLVAASKLPCSMAPHMFAISLMALLVSSDVPNLLYSSPSRPLISSSFFLSA